MPTLTERLAEALRLKVLADRETADDAIGDAEAWNEAAEYTLALLPDLARALATADAATDEAVKYGNGLFCELTAAKAENQRLTERLEDERERVRDLRDACEHRQANAEQAYRVRDLALEAYFQVIEKADDVDTAVREHEDQCKADIAAAEQERDQARRELEECRAVCERLRKIEVAAREAEWALGGEAIMRHESPRRELCEALGIEFL